MALVRLQRGANKLKAYHKITLQGQNLGVSSHTLNPARFLFEIST